MSDSVLYAYKQNYMRKLTIVLAIPFFLNTLEYRYNKNTK